MTGMLGSGSATVLGLPRSFDLAKELRRARSVKLVTAFAHVTGWSSFRRAVTDGDAQVTFVAGTDFMRTEPTVLNDWLELAHAGRGKAYVSLRSKSGVFHPKVLIVQGPRSHWAIVGSGNLSNGGLRTNVECSVFQNDRTEVGRVDRWFDSLLREDAEGPASVIELTDEWLVDYRRKYRKAQLIRRESDRKIRSLAFELRATETKRSRRWSSIASLVRRKVRTAAFRDRLKDWERAAEIPGILKTPDFDFTRDDWLQFYEIHALGTLRQAKKWSCWPQIRTLRAGLRRLIDEDLPVEDRIDDLVHTKGRYNVNGVGINTATKILAAHRPTHWPVWNGPVEDTLTRLGYEQPRASPGVKYAAFARDMRQLLADTPAKNMIELDCVFFDEA